MLVAENSECRVLNGHSRLSSKSTAVCWTLPTRRPHVLCHLGFPMGQWSRIPLPMRETRVPSVGREDPLEEEMATHSSILAWRILWTEEPGGLQFMGSHRVGHDPVTKQELCHLTLWGMAPFPR